MKAMIGAVAVVVFGLAGAALTARAEVPADSRYTLTVEAPARKVGEVGVVRLVIKPQKGWHWNKEYPAKLVLAAPTGVTVTKAELKQLDGDFKLEAGNATATFTVTAKAVGPANAKLTGKFGVCDDRSCVTVKVDQVVAVGAR